MKICTMGHEIPRKKCRICNPAISTVPVVAYLVTVEAPSGERQEVFAYKPVETIERLKSRSCYDLKVMSVHQGEGLHIRSYLRGHGDISRFKEVSWCKVCNEKIAKVADRFCSYKCYKKTVGL